MAAEGIREVRLTANGSLLPRLSKPLRQAGAQRLNISPDTLNEAKHARITRRGALSEALDGPESALGADVAHTKINTVLIGGFNDGEIGGLAALTMRYPVDVRFIEPLPMVEQFRKTVRGKPVCHDGLSARKHSGAGRNINHIGG